MKAPVWLAVALCWACESAPVPPPAAKVTDASASDLAAPSDVATARPRAEVTRSADQIAADDPAPCPACPTLTELAPLPVSAGGEISAPLQVVPPGAFVRLRLPAVTQGAPCWAIAGVVQTPAPDYLLLPMPATGLPAVRLVECQTGLAPPLVAGTDLQVPLPTHVVVDWLAGPDLGTEAQVQLQVRVHVLPGALPQGPADPLLAAALQDAKIAWQTAGIALQVSVQTAPSGPSAPLGVDVGAELEWTPDSASLRNLLNQLGEAQGLARVGVPVVVAPCLRRTNPALQSSQLLGGSVVRIPGGLPMTGAADGVLVATGHCPSDQPVTAQKLGWRLAHELGHWLGLHHPVEASGQADTLADTGDGQPNLMTREELLVPSLTLTPGQRAVARRHPALQTIP